MTDASSTPSQPAPSAQPSGPAGEPPAERSYAYPFLAESWWALGLRGAIAILFGLIAFLAPGPTIVSIILVFGIYVIIDGVLGIVAAVRAARKSERWGLLLLEGIANILMGVVAVLLPVFTAIAFVLALAAWALVTGVLMVAAAFRMGPDQGRWWLALSGVSSVLFAVALVILPMVGLVVLTWWLGAYAIVFGAGLLMLAYRLRARPVQSTAPAA